MVERDQQKKKQNLPNQIVFIYDSFKGNFCADGGSQDTLRKEMKVRQDACIIQNESGF